MQLLSLNNRLWFINASVAEVVVGSTGVGGAKAINRQVHIVTIVATM
jgi:hypothetical protein